MSLLSDAQAFLAAVEADVEAALTSPIAAQIAVTALTALAPVVEADAPNIIAEELEKAAFDYVIAKLQAQIPATT